MKFFALLLFALAFLLPGCVAYQPLQFEPVKKAAAIAPKFTESYYYGDRDHNLYFVMRTNSTDSATGKLIQQIATVRVFWHPIGGVTTLNTSALNATFRYVLMTPDAVGMYEGAGFVRLNSKDGALKFEARVVDGDMRLTQASAGFNDTLGRASIHGYFSATYDDVRAVEMLLEAHRDFFARSLIAHPASAPATTGTSRPSAEDWGIPGAATTTPATQP